MVIGRHVGSDVDEIALLQALGSALKVIARDCHAAAGRDRFHHRIFRRPAVYQRGVGIEAHRVELFARRATPEQRPRWVIPA